MGTAWTNQILTFLVIPTGATTGARISINVDQDGAILVYNSSDTLVSAISPYGGTDPEGAGYGAGFWTFDPVRQIGLTINDGAVVFQEIGETDLAAIISYTGTGAGAAHLTLTSGNLAGGGSGQSLLDLASDDGSGILAHVGVEQEVSAGISITGNVVQSDGNGSPTFMHAGLLPAGATTDASGNYTLTHGAAFTPTGVFCAYDSTSRAGGPFFASYFNITATQIGTHWESDGASYASQPIFGNFIAWA